MKKQRKDVVSREELFVGMDLHKRDWQVCIRTADAELFSSNTPGNWGALRRLLERYKGYKIEVVYEAGLVGFWLYDRLMVYGVGSIVTRQSLVPQEYANPNRLPATKLQRAGLKIAVLKLPSMQMRS